jgi:hypothetical protein
MSDLGQQDAADLEGLVLPLQRQRIVLLGGDACCPIRANVPGGWQEYLVARIFGGKNIWWQEYFFETSGRRSKGKKSWKTR